MRTKARGRKVRRGPRSEANPSLQAAILEAVENQLADENLPEVRQTLNRLIEEGFSERKARLYIGTALLFEVNDVLRTMAPFNRQRYVETLNRLPDLE